MPTKLSELQQKRNVLYGRIKTLGDSFNAEKRWAPGEKEKWERTNADYDVVTAEIEAEERNIRNRQSINQSIRRTSASMTPRLGSSAAAVSMADDAQPTMLANT